MTGNKHRETKDQKEVDLDVINCNIPEDTSHYTSSDKKAPNLATYYFKHEDTDSSMDKVEQQSAIEEEETVAQNTQDECSEEGYTKHQETKESNSPTKNEDTNPYEPPKVKLREKNFTQVRPKSIPEEKIRKLVQKVEELVSADRRSLNKITRMNTWIALDKPDDSCDASGEDDERESQTSEDFNESSTTLREYSNSQNTSFDELNSSKGSRQWLESMTPFEGVSSTPGINSFSISESALHRMNLNPKEQYRFSTSFSTVSSNNVNINSNNSTSSTVEEIPPLITEKASPMRKKKSKLKKKAMSLRYESCTLNIRQPQYRPIN
nr:uncharacterized protein LOC111502866 [Leptinotarsa decemlineata]